MSQDRVRLFVALELPETVRSALAETVPPSAALRPVAAEALHVTLCFLGWQPASAIDEIAATCHLIASEPAPELAVGHTVWLPRRGPRVLAVELHDAEGRLTRIQAALSAALATGGWYEPEKRPYLAHVTVARVKDRAGGRSVELPDPPDIEFRALRVVLYRSRLLRSGAEYQPLAGIELAEP